MRRAARFLAAVLLLVESVFAVDLAKIDRHIAKLPQFRADHQEYCLLVFGPDAHKRVWLIQDGDALYVDRNSNGDLTEPDERIAADPDYGNPEDGVTQFKAGNILDGKLLHKDLRIYCTKLSFEVRSDPEIQKIVDANPKFRGHQLSVDVEMPGQRGSGFDGRIRQSVSTRDANGLLQFATRPEEAPITHFGGPWQITFYSKDDWHQGTTEEIDLSVGTPGLGPGTTAFVAYEGAIPLGINPTVKVTFPSAAAHPEVTVKSYELSKRCCGVNLYGNMIVPTDIGIGPASVTLSIPSWPGASVASTTHSINIVPPKPPLKLEPVSWRLKRSLARVNKGLANDLLSTLGDFVASQVHVNKGLSHRGVIVEIQYSPDGKRLIAGDYDRSPVVQVWDVATGQPQISVQTGLGHPSNYEFFAISPDWKFLYAPTIRKNQKAEKIEKDGKPFMRWTFGDSIQVFDLNSGELLREFKHAPPRAMSYIQMAPDGSRLITFEELPGEYENAPKPVWSLWDRQTGEPRDFPAQQSGIALFSADSKTAISVIEKGRGGSHVDCLKVLDFPACDERRTIALDKAVTSASVLALAAKDTMIVGSTTGAEKHTAVKLWDVASGRELASLPTDENCGGLFRAQTSPDGGAVAIVCEPEDGKHGGVYVVDVAARTARFVDLGKEAFLGRAVFHPDGKWIVACANILPKDIQANSDPPYTDVPQPRLYVIEVAGGKVVETLTAPQCFLNSLAFSPDGNTLASSGPGEVLLWDFSIPPGQERPAK